MSAVLAFAHHRQIANRKANLNRKKWWRQFFSVNLWNGPDFEKIQSRANATHDATRIFPSIHCRLDVSISNRSNIDGSRMHAKIGSLIAIATDQRWYRITHI
jgi:hypothetical protein